MKYVAILLAFALSACSGAPQDRQNNADQIFGTAKMGLVVASGLVSVYNMLPVCADGGPTPPLCYSNAVGDILNKGLEVASSAIQSSEAIFAAANTDAEARLKAANIAKTVIVELMRNLALYGVTQIKAG